jgi:glutamate-1-semialdehyde aminotransferase
MEPVIGQRPKCGYKDKINPRSSLKACINCPQTNALKRIKLLAKKNKALFILDECISGFRFNIGGAQNYFGVSADLSIFGKGVTNGMPLGILTGKKKYMKHFDKVFLSSTYAPEALTLAAAIENLKILKKDNVIKSLWEKGEYIEKNFTNIITKYSISQYVSLAGYPVRLMINTHDVNGKQDRFLSTLYQQEMFKNGILCFAGVLMLSQSLRLSDLNILINAFDKTCFKIKSAIDSNRPFKKLLTCKPMSPVFKGLRERNAVSN